MHQNNKVPQIRHHNLKQNHHFIKVLLPFLLLQMKGISHLDHSREGIIVK